MSLLRAPLRCARTAGPALRPALRQTAARQYATGYGNQPTGGPTPQSAMKRNTLLAGVLLTASLAVWYYETKEMGVYTPEPEFTVTLGSGSRRRTETFKFKPDAELEKMLHEHEKTNEPKRAGNPVARWDTNYVASNEPCEDRSAADVVERGPGPASWYGKWFGSAPAVDETKPGKRDLVMVSVIDGHAGDATSRLLARTLHPSLTVNLAGLQAGLVPGATWYTKIADTLTWANTWSPANVSKTLQSAYVQLDDNICNTPIAMLTDLLKAADPVEAREKFVAMAAPASAGAVTASMVFDAENDGLYVAVAGDCRAVAGWQAADGSWRCDTLTEDQMGENPKEVARMRAEHPWKEAETVIRNGRVQGGLQPTRAFGDAVYKWTTAQGEAIAEVFRAQGEKGRPVRPWNFTPPYVTALPEVTYRSIRKNGEKLKFVVLATDGLWDRITSEEAALLMAGYMAHPKRPDVSKSTLAGEIPVATTEPRPYPVQDMPGKGKQSQGTWAFEGDANAATHLIRNALGGGDRKERGQLLSMHGKATRYFRDDMTVTVVFVDDE